MGLKARGTRGFRASRVCAQTYKQKPITLAHPAPLPPIGRGPMICYAPNAKFPQLFSLAFHLKPHFNIEPYPKHACRK